MKFKDFLSLQFLRYAIVGGTATLIDIATFYYFINNFALGIHIPFILGFLFGVLANFILCAIFIFETKKINMPAALLRHYVASSFGATLNWVLYQVIVYLFQSGLIIARCAACAITFGLNFLMFKYFTFKQK